MAGKDKNWGNGTRVDWGKLNLAYLVACQCKGKGHPELQACALGTLPQADLCSSPQCSHSSGKQMDT